MLGRGPGELLVEAAVVPGPEGEVLAEADETVLDTAPPAHLGHLVRAGERQPPGGEKHLLYFCGLGVDIMVIPSTE